MNVSRSRSVATAARKKTMDRETFKNTAKLLVETMNRCCDDDFTLQSVRMELLFMKELPFFSGSIGDLNAWGNTPPEVLTNLLKQARIKLEGALKARI